MLCRDETIFETISGSAVQIVTMIVGRFVIREVNKSTPHWIISGIRLVSVETIPVTISGSRSQID